MANRVVYGKTHSENGWPMVDTSSCRWVKVPGTGVTLQIREGQPERIMGAFAADFNAYVEPLRDSDSACWTLTNSVDTSNHLSGTGMDLNWNGADGRTFRLGISKERAYPGPKAKALDELLEWYEGMIFCGGYWSIQDWMHFQMGGRTYGSQNFEKVEDFIRRKIRPDGFSTYKRDGGTAPIPAPIEGGAEILSRATGLSVTQASKILPQVTDGLLAADCGNVKRIAMWLAQVGHESDSFRATEEYANGDESTDRWKYKGRTWIQITWKTNYAQFSRWCFDRQLVPDPDFFVRDPKALAQQKWAGLGPAWYWTVARPTINALCDRSDIVGVTQLINGGQNGITDRRNSYDRALKLGDKLLLLLRIDTGDDMAQVPQDQWDRVFREQTQRHPSRSRLRRLGEGLVDTWAGFTLADDGNDHLVAVKNLAEIGDPESLDLLFELADADPNEHPDRVGDAALARRILQHVARVNPEVLQEYIRTAE